MTPRPDGERLATLEARMLDQDKKLDQIVGDIKEIKISLGIYSDFKIQINELKSEVAGLKDRVGQHDKISILWRWLAPTMAAVAGSILTVLIISYLDKLR